MVSRNSKGTGESWSAWESGNHIDATRPYQCHKKRRQKIKLLWLMQEYREICCVNTSEIRRFSRTCQIDQTLLQCWSRKEHMTLDDDQLDRLNGSCREYTLSRSDQSSQVNGWICGNTKIGPVLDVMVFYHLGRYGVEIKIESLFGDKLSLGSDREWN